MDPPAVSGINRPKRSEGCGVSHSSVHAASADPYDRPKLKRILDGCRARVPLWCVQIERGGFAVGLRSNC